MKTVFLALSAAVTLAVMSPFAFAADAASGQSRTQEVNYSDLNVNTDDGAKSLYHRLGNAAENVCRDYDARSLSQREHRNECIAVALNDAVAQVGSRRLAELHAGNGHREFASITTPAKR